MTLYSHYILNKKIIIMSIGDLVLSYSLYWIYLDKILLANINMDYKKI